MTWAGGTAFEIFMAYIVIPTLGWRYLVAFSALPTLLTLFGIWVSSSILQSIILNKVNKIIS